MIAGIKECSDSLARKRGISHYEAESIMKDVIEVFVEKFLDGGVSFKGLFSIKKKIKNGRKGVCYNKSWETKDKYSLSISVGKLLDGELNMDI